MPVSDPTRARLSFRPRHRLRHAREFQAVYAAKVRKERDGVVLYAVPNTLPHCRLGLSIGKRIGGAVVRNHVKRMLREAFRLEGLGLEVPHPAAEAPEPGVGPGDAPPPPIGFDLVVSVRRYEPQMALERYRVALRGLVEAVQREWHRRLRREPRP